jgi:fused signal recognition particle receptor
METLLLVLIVVVFVFGVSVVLWNRRTASKVGPGMGGGVEVPGPPVVDRPGVDQPAVDRADVEQLDDAPIAEVVEQMVEYAVEQAVEHVLEHVVERPSFRSRMGRARGALSGAFLGIRGRRGITDDTWNDLEEALLRADVGVRVTDELLDGLRAAVKAKQIIEPDQLLAALQDEMITRLAGADRSLRFDVDTDGRPNVWLFVGVNGVGKTTTIGKVARQQTDLGRRVLLAAGDTFRAAAAEQLGTWAERSGAELVRGNEGGDPSAVIFDGIERAAARGVDLVLGDTAGRLHTKSNLMDELRKVRRVADKGRGVVTEVLLVIDATTGQNGLTQAREFGAATAVGDGEGLTGVVLTKLDGSAKGGIVFAIETELGLPVKLVGLGETIGDLVPFDPADFVGALFDAD